jgi:IS6 family transposase
MSPHRPRQTIAQSAFAGFCFPSDVIVLAVRWYLRYGLSYRDVADASREVDVVTVGCLVEVGGLPRGLASYRL